MAGACDDSRMGSFAYQVSQESPEYTGDPPSAETNPSPAVPHRACARLVKIEVARARLTRDGDGRTDER